MKNRIQIFLLCILITGCQTLNPDFDNSSDMSDNSSLTIEEKANNSFSDVISKYSFISSTGEIRYVLAEDSLIRIRIGFDYGGPLLHTLVDWEERKKGEHIEVWNRKNADGSIDFADKGKFKVVIGCLPMDEKKRAEYNGPDRGYRKSPEVTITFPEVTETTDEGLPIVSGTVPILVSLADKDRAWMAGTRYEVAMFIDNVFLSEEEEGISPLTYLLKTQGITEGRHLITVNIIGMSGEIGTVSREVYIK